jgi:integrase/recombinase XerD
MSGLTIRRNTAGPVVPALIAGAGDRAALRFIEFFTVTIRNKNTRTAYARATADFLQWCEGQGIGALGHVQPVHVAAYIERLQGKRSAPTVKQHLACIRMLFDRLVTGQVMPTNPAHSVRGPRHSVTKGVTPVLSSEEATALLTGMGCFNGCGSARSGRHRRDDVHLRPRRRSHRSLGRGLLPAEKRWWLRLHEKNGKVNEMPCHHKLGEYLDAYITAAGVAGDRKVPLFRSAIGKTKRLSAGTMSRTDVWYMVRRRAADAGIETAIGCHTFRATGITDYLTNGGRIEVAQRMAGHSNAKTTGLYDRSNDDISVGEVERIGI